MTCMKVNWKGLTARIWTYDYTHIFLHISQCVCGKVHMCTDTYMGDMYTHVHMEIRGQFQAWFLRCYPLILCTYGVGDHLPFH